MTGEQKLAAAILSEAVDNLAGICLQETSVRQRRSKASRDRETREAQADARRWIASPEVYTDEGISFLRCCFALGLTPSRLRAELATAAGLEKSRARFASWGKSQDRATTGQQIGCRFRRGAAA